MNAIVLVAALCGQVTVEGEPGRLVELVGKTEPPDGFDVLSQTWQMCCNEDACDWRTYILQTGKSQLVFTSPRAGTWRPTFSVTYVNWDSRASTTEQLVYTITIRGPPPEVEPPPPEVPENPTPPAAERLSVYVYESYDMTAPLYLNPARAELNKVPQTLLAVDKDSEGAETPTAAIEAGVANGLPALVVCSVDGSEVLAVTDDPGSAEAIVEFCTRETYDAD